MPPLSNRGEPGKLLISISSFCSWRGRVDQLLDEPAVLKAQATFTLDRAQKFGQGAYGSRAISRRAHLRGRRFGIAFSADHRS